MGCSARFRNLHATGDKNRIKHGPAVSGHADSLPAAADIMMEPKTKRAANLAHLDWIYF